MKPYIFDVSGNDALPLEYKLNDRNARCQANISDFVNNTSFFRFHRSEEGGFEGLLAAGWIFHRQN